MRYLKISKELIRNVLEKETENLPDDFTFDIIDNYIIFADDGECMFEVNIYEFAFKCKEWARDKYNITISSALYSNYAKSWNVDKDKSYTAKTEVEVIIKACQWILEISDSAILSEREID